MADDTDQSEKTEDPSQRKLEEAQRRGDVPKSQELSSAFILAGGTLVIAAMMAGPMQELSVLFKGLLANASTIGLDGGAIILLTQELASEIALAVALPFLLLVAMAVAGNIVQHPPVFSVEPITPKLSKISPLAGFKRLFSLESLVNFAKGLVKILVVGVLMGIILYPQRDRLDEVLRMDLIQFLPVVLDMAVALMLASAGFMIVVGVADFLYQKNRWFEKQKMTLKEVKDEFKQQEGDPAIKAKLRQVRMERSKRRMMAEVPNATVVVTNPTHFAVALKYEDDMDAPVCVAKGVDTIAFAIRQKAREHEIAIVENPPLARSLHASVEIDEVIPPEHFEAVAKVISFVMRLRDRRAARA